MGSPTAESIKEIERLIRSGDGAAAQAMITALCKETIDRDFAAVVGGLAWRVGLPLLGIRLLNPLVRPASRKPTTATLAEKVEYAGCLVKIGAAEEALALVGSLPSTEYPRQLLIHAFAHISRWDYHSARPLLALYVRHPHVSAYDRLVGKVNLAEALVHDSQISKAQVALNELLHDSSLRRLHLIYGKTLELTAQFAVERKKFDEADALLKKAKTALGKTNLIDQFFVKKWSAFSELLRNKGGDENLARVREVKTEAQARSHWETVRDCDRVLATVTRDEPLFRHLYHGTPYQAFRTHLMKVPHHPADWGQNYLWQVGPKATSAVSLSLVEGSSALRGPLRPEQLLHRLMMTLTSDFYRPFRVAPLFAHLYPDEHYNPESSPHRLHQALKRLREFFHEEKLPLEVAEAGGMYRLSATAPFSILIPARNQAPTKKSSFLSLVRKQWPDAPFSVNELGTRLNCSPRSALTLVKQAVETGDLVKEGSGPRTRYRLASG